MMKSAENRLGGELTEPLDRPMAWRILIQGRMRSEFVVITSVGHKDSAQVDAAAEGAVDQLGKYVKSLFGGKESDAVAAAEAFRVESCR